MIFEKERRPLSVQFSGQTLLSPFYQNFMFAVTISSLLSTVEYQRVRLSPALRSNVRGLVSNVKYREIMKKRNATNKSKAQWYAVKRRRLNNWTIFSDFFLFLFSLLELTF